MPKYIAKQSIGHYRPGDEIKGLEDTQIQALLVSGAIEEYKPSEETQPKADGTTSQLAKLAAEIADLKADNQKLVDEKTKDAAEIADLKAQLTKLEEQLKTATSKKPTAKTADDAK
ncbi:hypothetical protein [Acinetobacter bereziniae]|uniref:hypothetical protein n=1 Tax=Acinetobacter bereziniae TaxID=106648 RepID=UPI0011175EBF|nr:hypothetical protein [Acinetobacter bereziniae]TNL41719.1 hypothetical protein EYB59_22940 [Acinetobacter bereziniae]TNL46794.1 hypothetical protein EYY58_22615 [Acinetobacter bereziniae]